MNADPPDFVTWLTDYYLLATVLLAIVLGASGVVRQPARRRAIAWATVLGLLSLALLCALPQWARIHLLSAPAAPISTAGEQPESVTLVTPPPGVELGWAGTLRPHLIIQPEESPFLFPEPDVVVRIDYEAIGLGIFLAGSVLVVGWLALGSWQVRRLCARASRPPARVAELLRALVDPASATPELGVVNLPVPVAVGLTRPMILLPASLVATAQADELRAVLSHELAHIRHRDLWLLAALRVLLVVVWAHPLFWLLRRRVRIDQELLADAAAAEVSSRQDYAEQLVHIARSAATVRPPRLASSVGLWEGPSQLKQRITVLLNEKFSVWKNCSRRWRICSAALLGVGAMLLSLVTLSPPTAESQTAMDVAETDAAFPEVDFDDLVQQSSDRVGFGEAVAELVAAHIRRSQLPFIDDARLEQVQRDFADLVREHAPADASLKDRRQLLVALRENGGRHLALPSREHASARDLNIAYLAFPNRLKTIEWNLWMALARPPLDDAGRARLESQRDWMRGKVAEIPKHESPLVTHEEVLAELETLFADPLCAVFANPMSDEAYEGFQEKIDAWLDSARTGGVPDVPWATTHTGSERPYNPLPHMDHHFLREALYAQWQGERGKPQFPTFDSDAIVGYGVGGRTVRLSFASNQQFASGSLSLDSVDKRGHVLDVATGSIVSRDGNQNVGDIGYTTDEWDSIIPFRGAKLLYLNVDNWFEADAIPTEELRRRIEREGAETGLDLREYEHHWGKLAEDGGPYIGVLTGAGRVAVVHVEDLTRSGDESNITVWSRVRPVAESRLTPKPAPQGKPTVRIFAIGTNGEQPVTWWSEKGEPIDQPVLALTPVDNISPIPNRQIIFAVEGAPSDADVTWQTSPASNTATNRVSSGDPEDKAQYFGHLFDVKDATKVFGLRVGVAAGSWTTISSGLNSAMGIMGKNLVFSPAVTDSRGNTSVIVSHNFDDWATRVVGVDKAGNRHVGVASGGTSAGPLNQTNWHFPGLTLGDLETCEFQTRPYEWTEFKELPAEPTSVDELAADILTVPGVPPADTGINTHLPGQLLLIADLEEKRTSLGAFPYAVISANPNLGTWTRLVDVPLGAGPPEFSRDGQHCFFQYFDGTRRGVLMVNTNGNSEPKHVSDHSGQVSCNPVGNEIIVSSPDFPKIEKPKETKESDENKEGDAFVITAVPRPSGHWRINLDEGTEEKLNIPTDYRIDDWSPDGNWLVATSWLGEQKGFVGDLYLMRPDGSDRRKLTAHGHGCNWPRFSSDGKYVVYCFSGKRGGLLHSSIRIIDISTQADTELIGHDNWLKDGKPSGPYCWYHFPTWSPDDNWLAIALDQQDASVKSTRKQGILLISRDGSQREQLELQTGADFGSFTQRPYWAHGNKPPIDHIFHPNPKTSGRR